MAKTKARKRKAAQPKLGPLYQPSQNLSGQALKKAAAGVVGAAYGPQTSALKQQMSDVTTQGTALIGKASDYYRQMAESELGRMTKQKALGQMLKDSTAATAGESAAAYADMAKQETQRAQADARTRGAGLAGGGDVLGELAALKARSDTVGKAASDRASSQAGNWEGLLGAMGVARSMRGGEQVERLSNRLANSQQKVRNDMQTLAEQRGNAMAKALVDLRQQSFTNALTQEQLGVKKADLKATMTNIKADNQLGRDRLNFDKDKANAELAIKRGIDPVTGKKLPKKTSASEALAKWKLHYARANGRLPSTGTPAGKTAKDEPAASIEYKQNIEASRSRFRTLLNTKRGRTRGEAWVKQQMLKEGVPPAIYNAVYDLERKGTLHPANASALEVLGVVVPKAWRRRRAGASSSAMPHNKR